MMVLLTGETTESLYQFLGESMSNFKNKSGKEPSCSLLDFGMHDELFRRSFISFPDNYKDFTPKYLDSLKTAKEIRCSKSRYKQ